MAQPQKFITLSNGRQILASIESVSTTTGSSDASKLIRTNASGQIDETFLPAGIGSDVLSIVASEAMSAGTFVNIFDDAGTVSIRKADGSVTGKEVDGFILANVAENDPVNVYLEGVNNQLTGLTIGARYYLSHTVPGTATATLPGAPVAGSVIQYVGKATAADKISFEADEGVIIE